MDSRVDTYKHKQMICNLMNFIIQILSSRALEHDNCKLESPECELFDEITEKLKTSTYGSDDYNEFLKHLKPAFVNGCKDMNIIDIIEMLVDWKAATLRHDDGNILKSIEYNAKTF